MNSAFRRRNSETKILFVKQQESVIWNSTAAERGRAGKGREGKSVGHRSSASSGEEFGCRGWGDRKLLQGHKGGGRGRGTRTGERPPPPPLEILLRFPRPGKGPILGTKPARVAFSAVCLRREWESAYIHYFAGWRRGRGPGLGRRTFLWEKIYTVREYKKWACVHLRGPPATRWEVTKSGIARADRRCRETR